MAKKNLLSKYLGKEEETPSSMDHEVEEPGNEEPKTEDPIAEESPAPQVQSEEQETDTPPQDKSENDSNEKPPETEEPKRGRKKGTRRDRVIVMLSRETIEILDSFAISRSGTARSVILGCQDFLVNLEGEISEDELTSKIKEKLA